VKNNNKPNIFSFSNSNFKNQKMTAQPAFTIVKYFSFELHIQQELKQDYSTAPRKVTRDTTHSKAKHHQVWNNYACASPGRCRLLAQNIPESKSAAPLQAINLRRKAASILWETQQLISDKQKTIQPLTFVNAERT
jgi:hypothetical protein